MQKMDILDAKSIHIYGWSFMINSPNRGNNRCVENSITEFRNSLMRWGWIEKNFLSIDEQKNIYRDNFMLKKYLSNSAKQIFFNKNGDEAICSVYKYPFKENEYIYHIKKGDDIYKLPIEDIELHIYSCGVGILFFKALNYKYCNIEDIKIINDCGRRINVAYIPKEEGAQCLWADEVGVEVKNSGNNIIYSSIMDYKGMLKAILAGNDEKDNIDKMEAPAEFLTKILYVELEKEEKEKEKREQEKQRYRIESYSDDRMFLMSMIRDSALSEECKKLSEEYEFKKDEKDEKRKLEDKIYSIMYVDAEEATCQDVRMRRELLDKALYRRWLDYGSVYGVTSYSYIAITTDSEVVNNSVVCPFYYEYIFFISLVLAQRIGIARFSYETVLNAEITELRERKTGKEKQRCIIMWILMRIAGIICAFPSFVKNSYKGWKKSGEYIKLQRRYIVFKNQMLILEASCQDQGIEIYNLLQEQLLVKEEQQILESQVQGLYEMFSTWRGNFWSKIGFLGSLVVVIFKGIDKVFNELNGSYFFDYIAKIIATWIRN